MIWGFGYAVHLSLAFMATLGHEMPNFKKTISVQTKKALGRTPEANRGF